MLTGTFGDRSICRLGLASRGNTHLRSEQVHVALEAGVNFLNWCGNPNGLSQAIRELGDARSEVMVCAQFDARSAKSAQQELKSMLQDLGTDYLDVVTFYYVEHESEWETILGPNGALEYCQKAKEEGLIRHLGLTSHQRKLAARWAESGYLDMLMIRYNAAHRGAEEDVFPITDALGMPVVVYTCLRWGALMESTSDDPPGFEPPPAPMWYRFALQSPSVTVAVMAPDDADELAENLEILNSPALTEEEMEQLASHGQRVRKHASYFW